MKTIKRRRIEGKTDYNARLKMLESRMPRIVIRKSNKYITAQFVESSQAQDKVIIAVSSRDLLDHGWDKTRSGSLKSVPACYFTGLLLGKQVKGKQAIIDLGLIRSIKKGRIYAVVKGIIDGGAKVNAGKEAFPDEKRIKGEHMNKKIDFEKIKKEILK
jgi:large subunit ribosomal protein L18